MPKKEEKRVIKAVERSKVNLSLLGICFSLFTFIIAINSSILQDNFLLALELTISIPLFLSSVFANSKLAYAKKPEMWRKFGFATYLVGYGFLINVIGMLLSSFVSVKISIIFFALNIITALTYSFLEVIEDRKKLKSRICKDLFFILLLVICGILPSLGVWGLHF